MGNVSTKAIIRNSQAAKKLEVANHTAFQLQIRDCPTLNAFVSPFENVVSGDEDHKRGVLKYKAKEGNNEKEIGFYASRVADGIGRAQGVLFALK